MNYFVWVSFYRIFIENHNKYLGQGHIQIFPWRASLLQSLAPTLIKLNYLWFSNDLEDSD